MSDFVVSDHMPVTEKGQKKDSRITIVKIIVLILCILLVIEGIFYMLVIPCLAPVKVQFSGLKNLSSSVLLEKLSQTGGVTWIQFDSSKAVDNLSTLSAVDTVSVDKIFPDKVVIDVKERTPVAKTIVSINGRSMSVQIDENGVLFSNASSVANDSNIPLISGLPIENMQPGMRFPAKYKPLMAQIAEIQKLPQKYFVAISEIQVVPKEYGNYELVLYPIHTHVRVLTDRSLNEEALKYMMVVLDVVNSLEPGVREIDLRYGSVSYRSR
ncbi:MAG: FtsQ-type POTRA domain-containing protein [Treponema sp.]|nr:FtsQ-type POTRA domain-containing protein [Treponema sp.]